MRHAQGVVDFRERNNSTRLIRQAYVAVSVMWALMLVLLWQHSVLQGTLTTTTIVLTVEGVALSAVILLAAWQRRSAMTLNTILLVGMTVWVLTRISLRILIEGSLQGVSFVLITALTALAFTVLRPLAAFLYGLGGWLLLTLATVLSKADMTDVLVATAFALLMVGYAAVSGRQVETERRQRLEAERRAAVDKLTGLLNRSAGEATLAQAERAHRHSQVPAVIVLLDIDHFKSVNDRFGHAAGDETLRRVAAALSQSIRAEDVICRWGGEEFLIVYPSTRLAQAGPLLERVLEKVRSLNIPDVGSVTISAGACGLEEAPSAEAALQLADTRLYAAKSGGRNRAVMAEETLV